ncbi:MAG: ROK family protein [Hespellia sp.]|nr:ROK family protein [Hespellia sp.]
MIEAGKPRLLKERNQNMIEALVLQEGPITKPELADMTMLSVPTVNKIVAQLQEAGRIKPVEISNESKLGRKAIHYEGNESAVNVITVFYLNGKWIADVFNYKGCSIYRKIADVNVSSLEKTLQGFYELLDILAEQAVNLQAIGVGIPGVVATNGEIMSCASIPVWSGLNLKEEMEKKYQCPIFVENDVNLMALGYSKILPKKPADLVFLFLGQGVGAGIIINHRLHKGFSNFAGDFSYLEASSEEDFQFRKIERDLNHIQGRIEREPDNKKLRTQYYQIISKILISCITSLNPEEIVIHGLALEKEEAQEYLRCKMEACIPKRCNPKILIDPYDEYGVYGLSYQCLSEVTPKYYLEE